MKFLYLLLFVVLLSISVSAWPYELHSNGTIVDLNSSNNQSTNLTIYYYYTNVTNYTNVTYTNVTAEVNGSVCNTTELDTRYLRIGTQYGNTELFNRAELNEIFANLTNVDANLTAQINEKTKTQTGWLWGGILVAILLSAIALVGLTKDNY